MLSSGASVEAARARDISLSLPPVVRADNLAGESVRINGIAMLSCPVSAVTIKVAIDATDNVHRRLCKGNEAWDCDEVLNS